MNMTILLYSTTFPLSLEEKVEIRIPIQHTVGIIDHQLRFKIDPTIGNKNKFNVVPEPDGRQLVLLPNERVANSFFPMGYQFDERDTAMHLTMQPVEGGYLVTAAFVEITKTPA